MKELTKECYGCCKEKPLSDFYMKSPSHYSTKSDYYEEKKSDWAKKNARASRCKECMKKYYKKVKYKKHSSRKLKVSKSELEELYYDQELTYKEIAKKIGCNTASVHFYLNRYNIKKNRYTPKIDIDILQEMYYDKKLSIKEIAKEFKCTTNSVRSFMDRNNLERIYPSKKEPANKYRIDENELINLYCNQGLSQTDIAKKMSCSTYPIQHRLKKLGIKRNNRKKDTINDYEYSIIGLHEFKRFTASQLSYIHKCSANSVLNIIHRYNQKINKNKYRELDNYFDDLDELKAYGLGLISSDGSIRKGDIVIFSSDYSHLKIVQEKVFNGLGKFNKNRGNGYGTVHSLRLYSPIAVKKLNKLGIPSGKKSVIIKPLKLPEELLDAYWAGVFDGDGSIGVYDDMVVITMTGSYDICKAFRDRYLGKKKNGEDYAIVYDKRSLGCYSARKSTSLRNGDLSWVKNMMKSFYKAEIKKSGIYLKKKYDIFNSIVNN